jgi:hypothetical protein
LTRIRASRPGHGMLQFRVSRVHIVVQRTEAVCLCGAGQEDGSRGGTEERPFRAETAPSCGCVYRKQLDLEDAGLYARPQLPSFTARDARHVSNVWKSERHGGF